MNVIDEGVQTREFSHFCLLCNVSVDWPKTCMFWVVTYSTAEINPKTKAIAIVSLAVSDSHQTIIKGKISH